MWNPSIRARIARARTACGAVTATVREWSDEEGWGVLDSPQTPGGCFGHYADIQALGCRTLPAGQQVDLVWEAPGFRQDGYDYRAVSIVPRSV
ncbi:cold shock domain-containing protein [Streptomyces sp. NPDC059398]|uniref:cold shock domain-containing protein n=1 Tax=Streptomyces sp. NPDC059398 TaxID=3346820 RepID=UPI0036BC6FD6